MGLKSDKKTMDGDENNNPIVQQFRGYANELNDKDKRFQRIVKFSDEITNEIKELIVQLHSIDSRDSKAKYELSDVFNRLNTVCTNGFANIANELNVHDSDQYRCAYSGAVKDLVKAFSFYDYLANNDCFMDWNGLQKKLTYELKSSEQGPNSLPFIRKRAKRTEIPNAEIKCLVHPIDFMVGVAESSSEIEQSKVLDRACDFIRQLYLRYEYDIKISIPSEVVNIYFALY